MIKIYEVTGAFEGADKGDLFMLDKETNKYVLSKLEHDSGQDFTLDSTYTLTVSPEVIEDNNNFTLLHGSIDSLAEHVTDEMLEIRTVEDIKSRQNELEYTLNFLDNELEKSSDPEALIDIMDSLRKEYWTLDWVLNKN